MTAFGSVRAKIGEEWMVAEIKSVNSKVLDLQLKMDSEWKPFEGMIRRLISKYIERGRVECSLQLENKKTAAHHLHDSEKIDRFIQEVKAIEIRNQIPSSDYIALYLSLESENTVSFDEAAEAKVHEALEKMIQELIAFAEHEGAVLQKAIQISLSNISEILQKVPEIEVARKEKLEKDLREKITQMMGSEVTESRFAEEICYHIDRLDITEERVRLAKHIAYFDDVLGEEGNGKKLQFIAQEMLREINTMGSKANNAELQRLVVDMKTELEKIKEQLCNVY